MVGTGYPCGYVGFKKTGREAMSLRHGLSAIHFIRELLLGIAVTGCTAARIAAGVVTEAWAASITGTSQFFAYTIDALTVCAAFAAGQWRGR